MDRTRTLRPDWLPAVALSAALAAAMLAWNPPVGDLAAQVFRAELFDRDGLGIWNGSWYGGHYTLTYSFLFPPLAALLGPRLVATLAVVASAYLFDRLVRDRWGERARWATLWFAAGVVTLLADGQLTFALGVAFGLGALRLLQLGLPVPALLAAAACALSSPVAAAFLAGVAIAGAPWRDQRARLTAIWIACLALALVLVPNLAFPEDGQFPFVFSSYVAIPLFCAGALIVTRGLAVEERRLRRVLIAYALAATVLWLAPNPMGGNAIRLGALFGGPILAAVMLAHRPRLDRPTAALLALALAGGLYWQLTASVHQIARSAGDPSTAAAYFAPLAGWLREHGGRAARIEVPPTANHWESAHLAPDFELARGWLRQLDTTREAIFYGKRPLTHAAYRGWLRDSAISYVALPDAPLDYSAQAERRLILSRPPYLEPRWSNDDWRVYAVRDPAPLAQPLGAGQASVRRVTNSGFSLDVDRPGRFLVRVAFTPYWSIAHGRGCLVRRGEWTVARADHPGLFKVRADFSIPRAWNAVTGARKTC
jgi:hypothetical protein